MSSEKPPAPDASVEQAAPKPAAKPVAKKAAPAAKKSAPANKSVDASKPADTKTANPKVIAEKPAATLTESKPATSAVKPVAKKAAPAQPKSGVKPSPASAEKLVAPKAEVINSASSKSEAAKPAGKKPMAKTAQPKPVPKASAPVTAAKPV